MFGFEGVRDPNFRCDAVRCDDVRFEDALKGVHRRFALSAGFYCLFTL